MRTSLTLAAFAAGALAVPYKRDVVTNVNVVYVTDVVTVTAGQEPAAPVTKAEHYGHHNWATTTVIETTSTQAPATYVAPSPSSTSEAAPVYQAPAPSTYEAPAPVSSAAPAKEYSPPTTSSSAAAAPTDYKGIAVYHHNLHRSNHSAPDLEWDDGLASSAQIIAETCVYAHKT